MRYERGAGELAFLWKEKSQQVIMRLVHERGDELTAAIASGEKSVEQHFRTILREATDSFKTSGNKEILDSLAENRGRCGGEKPIQELLKNPHVDVGATLQVYWCFDAEYC
jgi:hypothetical protein